MKTLFASLLVLLSLLTTTTPLFSQNIIPTPTVTEQQIQALEAAEKATIPAVPPQQATAVPTNLIVAPPATQTEITTQETVKTETQKVIPAPQLTTTDDAPVPVAPVNPTTTNVSAPVAPATPKVADAPNPIAPATPATTNVSAPVVPATPAMADTPPPSAAPPVAVAKDPCLSMANQEEINQCAATDYSTAFTDMDDVYQKLMAQLNAEHQALLRNTQTTWTTFRDTQCACETFNHKNSSIEALLNYKCLTNLTRQRIENLKALMPE